MTHYKICWCCDLCNYITISDTRERHKMDSCLCEKTSIDLEETYARYQGKPRIIAELKEGKKWRVKRK